MSPVKNFLYFENQEGGMGAWEVTYPDPDLGFLYGWMSETCKEEDEALARWMTTAKLGQTLDHRLGILVCVEGR